jgi:hypothetical protein
LVGDRRRRDRGVAGVQAGDEDPRLEHPVHRPCRFDVLPSLLDGVVQRGASGAHPGVGGSELRHGDRVVRQLTPSSGPAFAHLAGDLVERAASDPARHRRQRGEEGGVDRQPPHGASGPRPIGEGAASIERNRDVRRADVVAAGAAQAGRVPSVLDDERVDWDEGDARRRVQPVDERSEADPRAVEAVARERPTTGEQMAIAVGDDAPGRGEHRGVALIRVGEDDPRGVLRQVAGEQVAAGADHRAPPRTAVDRRQPLEHVHGVGHRRLEASELLRQGEPVDLRIPQCRHDRVRQPPGLLDVLDGAGHDTQQVIDHRRSPIPVRDRFSHRRRHGSSITLVGAPHRSSKERSAMDQPTAEAALGALERLVGEWTVEARWASGEPWPGGGRATFEWHSSRAHVVERTTADLPEAPDSTSIIGCDAANGTYFQLYSDERGVCRVYEMAIDDREWTLWRQGEPFAQRFTATSSDDGNTMTGRWEIAEDSVNFRTDFELTYRRVLG